MRPRAAPLAVIAAALVMTACGDGGGQPTPTDTASPSGPDASVTASAAPGSEEPSPDAEGTVIAIVVGGGEVTGADDRVTVDLGSDVTLEVTSDVDDEIHVHGYDLHQDVTAGATATLTFTADIPGIFEVELEDASLLLTSLEVR